MAKSTELRKLHCEGTAGYSSGESEVVVMFRGLGNKGQAGIRSRC